MKIRKIGLVVIALLSIVSLSSFGKNSKSLEKTNQVVRTASIHQNLLMKIHCFWNLIVMK